MVAIQSEISIIIAMKLAEKSISDRKLALGQPRGECDIRHDVREFNKFVDKLLGAKKLGQIQRESV